MTVLYLEEIEIGDVKSNDCVDIYIKSKNMSDGVAAAINRQEAEDIIEHLTIVFNLNEEYV